MKDELFYRNQERLNFSQYDSNLRRQLYYSGGWDPAKTYEANELVDWVGSAWVCVATTPTTTEPGTVAGLADWDQLGGLVYEIWQATPIVGMSAQTVQWTFVPLTPGQTPRITSEAAGIFTFLNPGVVNIQLNPYVSFEFAANNSEASYSLTPVYTGTGLTVLLPILDSDNSPRAGSFGRTAFNRGGVIPVVGDTLSITADSTGTNGSDVDLVDMFLQMGGPVPRTP